MTAHRRISSAGDGGRPDPTAIPRRISTSVDILRTPLPEPARTEAPQPGTARTTTAAFTAPVLLEITGLAAGYGAIRAIEGVTMSIATGEIVTLLGANGAGKTTTLRTIAGVMAPQAGSIVFAGESLVGLEAHEVVAMGLAMVPEGRRIFPRLTVQENLTLGGWLRQDDAGLRRDLDHVFTLFPILRERLRQAGGTLSGGEQQMLAIARALMGRPRMLMMDEPSMGVAPIIVERIFEAIQALNREGLSILLVEQNARAALDIAHRGYVLEHGRIALQGLASHLACDDRVKAAYLGG
jgi:branched-chain amino acid transport system ATP-binding protein